MSRELSGRGAETRAAILDAALEAFAEGGFHGTSVRAIATRCGLTHPALLYHFPTKAELLIEVLRRRDDAEGTEAEFGAHGGRAVLDHLVETARRNAERRGVVELFTTLAAEATAPDHPAHAFFVERYAALREQLTAAYADLAAQQQLRAPVDPGIAASQLIAVMDGLQVQWLLDPSLDMAAAVRAHVAAQLA